MGCKIRDHNGVRHIPEDGFPIVIGGNPSADIWIAELEEHEEAGYIGLSKNRAFLKSGQSKVPILYNREKIEGSVFLFHGDRMQIGSNEIVFQVEGNDIIFKLIEPRMSLESNSPEPATVRNDVLEIEPISFRSGRRLKRLKSFTQYRWLIAVTLGFVFILLLASAWFVFTAKQVAILVDPEPDRISIGGCLIAPRIATYYLLHPGTYNLLAVKSCYHPLEHRFQVRDEKNQELRLQMKKLPGRFSLTAYRSDQPSVKIDGARVYIDGHEAGTTPIIEMEVNPGQRHLQIRAENYQELETDMVIQGCGEPQSIDVALVPSWADVFINTIPQYAKVFVDGNLAGKTPIEIQLLEGIYHLEISAAKFKTWETRLTVHANQPQTLQDILLEPADGTLALLTNPPGANVTVGKTYIGQTPLKVQLHQNAQHEILISKAGYEKILRKIEVSAGEWRELTVNLKPREGVIQFKVDPGDAELFVDGKTKGPVPQRLQLIAIKHQLEIKKEGYKSYRTQITPRPGFPQQLKITLTRIEPEEPGTLKVIKAENGYLLKLIRPQTFTMGSSRREQGRRSNETMRKIQLQRPFYMGIREVINKEFKEFLASHSSGVFKGHSLDQNELPVVQVTWEQAAMFCNWMSAKESLPQAYIRKGEDLVVAEPLSIGYRLPAEAEWEYCARFKNNQIQSKYPWGNKFPPTSQAGNYADISAKGLLSSYLENYNDGYPVTAPPAKFHANDLGLYDLGGNVAEWCHDYYSIYSYNDGKVYLDPLGPYQGNHHVVRGSSWKQSSISMLRLSYRDYCNSSRPDLGFRICRYLK